jgi:hypothetical protein
VPITIEPMTAKEKVLEQAPSWSEDDAQVALRAVEHKHQTEPESTAAEDPGEPETVWMPESWKTFEDGTPQPDWTALIRADRDHGH